MFRNQENPKESTYRPAIVVEDLQNEALVCFMTKQIKQQRNNPDSFIVQMSSPKGQQMGLTYDTLICPSRTMQIPKTIIIPPKRGIYPTDELDELLNLVEKYL